MLWGQGVDFIDGRFDWKRCLRNGSPSHDTSFSALFSLLSKSDRRIKSIADTELYSKRLDEVPQHEIEQTINAGVEVVRVFEDHNLKVKLVCVIGSDRIRQGANRRLPKMSCIALAPYGQCTCTSRFILTWCNLSRQSTSHIYCIAKSSICRRLYTTPFAVSSRVIDRAKNRALQTGGIRGWRPFVSACLTDLHCYVLNTACCVSVSYTINTSPHGELGEEETSRVGLHLRCCLSSRRQAILYSPWCDRTQSAALSLIF